MGPSGVCRASVDLSVHTVSLLHDIGSDGASSASTDVIATHKTAYLNTITQMLNEQKVLLAICHSHS